MSLLLTGNKDGTSPQQVYEITYPGCGLTLSDAPAARLLRNWGDVYQGKRLLGNPGGGYANTRGLLWHNNRLWWAYGGEYNTAGFWEPSIGYSLLNDDGTVSAYGPWRTTEHSQKTRGYLVQLPQEFADAYTGGRRLAVGAPGTSGMANAPHGPALFACSEPASSAAPDPTSADVTVNSVRSIETRRLILHDISHRMARDKNYRDCGWSTPNDYNSIPYLKDGTGVFGGDNNADMMSACVYIDSKAKHGIVFIGQMVAPVLGASYGTDTLPHIWYGKGTCPHGQNGSPPWEATGPGSGTNVAHWWIYDPTAFARVALGQADPWSLTPSSVVNVVNQWPTVPGDWVHCNWYKFGGAWFDQETGLLFVGVRSGQGASSGYHPTVHVWGVA